MTDLLDDLIAFFEARNTGNATNELLNRCKEEKKKQLLIHSVVKSLNFKETISFEDWKKRHLIDNDISGNYLHESEGWVKGTDLIKMYKREQSL